MTAKQRMLLLLGKRGITRASNVALAIEIQVSIVTVDICLRELEAEGKIRRRRVGRNREITVLA